VPDATQTGSSTVRVVMVASLAGYAVLGAVLIAFGRRLGPRAFFVGALAPATTLVLLVTRYDAVTGGRTYTEHVPWVRQLRLALDLRLDGFGMTMAFIVAGVGVLVFVYAERYFSDGTDDLGRLAGLLVLFAGAMLGVVLADQLLTLYAFWEVTSVTSYLLIGHNHRSPAARAAALHALMVTVAGGLAMLAGFVVIGQAAGTYRISELAAGRPTGTAVTVALVLVLIGAFAKSAQYPFHAWLPGAMSASTPVSAYLHSATMVKAGVYLVARLAPIFAVVVVWRPAVFLVGGTSLVLGGVRALRQYDLKLLLAYGTISQLGLMMVLFGAGTAAVSTAAWELLVAHALFKAALFMVVGVVEHQTGTRDLRRLPAFGSGWRGVEVVAALATVSMVGVPLGLGFVAKEAAYESLEHASFGSAGLVLGVVVVGSVLTAAYGARFFFGTFVMPRWRAREHALSTPPAVTAPSWRFVAPPATLAALGALFGVVPALLDQLATASLRALGFARREVHLELWHGFNRALLLSAVALALGSLLFLVDRWVQRALALGRRVPSGERVFLGVLRSLTLLSQRTTGIVQNGSLPVYAGVILSTAAVLPAAALFASWAGLGSPAIVGPIVVLPIVALLAVAAFGAASVRARFSAALFLGVAGYAMAGLFVVYGAPDLALTQAAIETLSTVLFVLVLRRLPDRFERQSSPRRRILRVGIAASVGVAVFVFALAASADRGPTPVSDEIVARAVPDGGGRNVVNVILVDFRALDTLGEITVLAAASIGAVALARVGHRAARERLEQQGNRAPETGAGPLSRIVFVDVSAQIVFYAILIGSLWLLFAGHNQPGGGFVGGLLAGSAIALRYIAGGMAEVRSLSRFRPWTVLGTGLLLATTTAVVPLLSANPLLDVASWSLHPPLFGAPKISTALLFDIGVYVTVIGMVLMVFEAFGDEPKEVSR
jgi:multicomponent Na+:H+ antiporter subunit A